MEKEAYVRLHDDSGRFDPAGRRDWVGSFNLKLLVRYFLFTATLLGAASCSDRSPTPEPILPPTVQGVVFKKVTLEGDAEHLTLTLVAGWDIPRARATVYVGGRSFGTLEADSEMTV